MILGNGEANGDEIPVDAHVLPASAVSSRHAIQILKYIDSDVKPTVLIGRSRTVVGISGAPAMAAFSSRGPNRLEPNLLKPDITAPGLNILAAWSEASSPTKLEDDHRIVKYNLMSGTSMACPHVSATAALLKSAHPLWTSAAIRSAIMTTGNSTQLILKSWLEALHSSLTYVMHV
ncbi:Subtilisin-like protease [Dendrobium catenatum]|uniref:Subtilisin-like protease n=1 Tax=Dendrobium catenatum TaxID=906689 RepID=A0A2I0VHD5_9ASPA|nr:Subtilisin-like protease [Dendrobium catenatum]